MSRNIIGILALLVLAGCDQEGREDPFTGVSENHQDFAWAKDTAGRFQDPICGQSVPADSPWKKFRRGRLYYFHSADCRSQFCENPFPYTDTPTYYHRPR